MSETPQDKKPRKISLRNVSYKKLNRTYDFLMSRDDTGRPMLNFKLNLLNLILVIIGIVLLLIIITTFIIAFTPLREYIPGYTDTNLNREVYELNLRADSLEKEMHKKDVYFDNLRKIVEGYDFAADSALANSCKFTYSTSSSRAFDIILLFGKTEAYSCIRHISSSHIISL